MRPLTSIFQSNQIFLPTSHLTTNPLNLPHLTMSGHHRPQQPLPSRSTRPSPSMPPTMQTRSSIARSTLSPDITRTTRRSVRPDRTVSPHPSRPRPSRSRNASSTVRMAAESLIDLTESSPTRYHDTTPQGDDWHHMKRRRTSPSGAIDEVDLTDLGESEEEAARRKAREELLKTQQAARKDEKRKVAGFTCVICMEDEPTDLAVTPCGTTHSLKVWF